VESALAGLDQEQPGGSFFGPALLRAVQAGQVPVAVVDDKARRILTPMFRFGLFDRPVEFGPGPGGGEPFPER
jgi:beta-glucosidase